MIHVLSAVDLGIAFLVVEDLLEATRLIYRTSFNWPRRTGTVRGSVVESSWPIIVSRSHRLVRFQPQQHVD